MAPIKVGIIGFGRSGCGIHVEAIRGIQEQFVVVAICDEIPERRSHEAFPNAKAYAVPEELLADPEVEMVVVATYNHTHVKYTKMALEAGKHVLCEKPFGYTVADVDEMIRVAEKNHRVLQPFQQRHFEQDFQKVIEICNCGVLGKIGYIRIFWPAFSRRWDWQTSRQRGGGQLYNNGPHLIDYGVTLFGDTEPHVSCTIRNMLGAADAEDEIDVRLSGPGRPDVQMIISATCAYPQDRWLICGTNGTLHGDNKKLNWKYVDWSKYPACPLDMRPLEGRCYCKEQLDFTEEEWVPAEVQADGGAGATPNSKPAIKLYDSLYRAIRFGEKQSITPLQIRSRIAVLEECYRQCNIKVSF